MTHALTALTALTALSPLDGRYAAQTRVLQEHFSEFALIRSRVPAAPSTLPAKSLAVPAIRSLSIMILLS